METGSYKADLNVYYPGNNLLRAMGCSQFKERARFNNPLYGMVTISVILPSPG